MSVFQHLPWQKGFPFSHGTILAGQHLPNRGVNLPLIVESGPHPVVENPVASVRHNSFPATVAPVWHDMRQISRHSGIRLLPLEGFTWGSRAKPPQPRTRPEHVLIWVTEGQVHLGFPRDHVVLRAGDLRHIPAGTAFAAVPVAGARGHAVLIAADLVSQATPPFPDRGLAAHVGTQAAQLEATLRELAAETPGSDPAAMACLMNLLSLRLGHLAPPRPRDAPEPGVSDRPMIDRFLALARQRLGESRSVAELAAELGCTTLLLDQACHAAHAKRAVDLIHDLQLECAVDMLRNTARPTQRIADELGYSSHAHFIRAFAAATGRAPDAFRAQSLGSSS